MARFEELNTNLYTALMKLVESQKLCKYLFYDTDANTDPLTKPDLDEKQRYSLIMSKIFPIPKSPDTQSTAGSLITVLFDRIDGSIAFKNSVLIINVLCHLDQWRMPAMLRPYAIMHEIDLLFNQQRVMGIGKLQFNRANFIAANNSFFGFRCEYSLVDFN